MMAESGLPIALDPTSHVPLAVQLAGRLREAILNGALRPEDTLPSSRRFAVQLGVSRGVVVRAFEQLSGEGYLESRGAAGTCIAIRADLQCATEPAAVDTPLHASKPLIDLSPGHPSAVPFQNREWRSAWRTSASEAAYSELPPALGVESLRKAIAGHLAISRGVAARAEDIIVTAGTSDALQLVVTGLRARSARPRILVEDPGYPTARRVLATAGAVVETLSTGPNGFAAEQLAAIANPPDAVVVTPSHQYPQGGSMPVKERLGLLAWAGKYEVLIIEDDYDSEFRHRRMPLPAIASLPSAAEVVLAGTFSKVLSPWLRCGYLVVRGDAGTQLKAARRDLDTPVSGVMQEALAHYIESGALARHITRARREYAHRRALLLDRLGRRRDVEVSGTDGGLHAVVRLPDAIRAEDVAAQALRAGVRLVTLETYYSGADRANGLVIGYGAPSDIELARGLDTLIGILDRPGP